MGGLRVEVTFTADGEKTVMLPTALPNVPRHVEPMSVPDYGDKTNPSAVGVRAVKTSEWTHKTVKLYAQSDGLDESPYPVTQTFRVY